ncbi:hypothetical protein J3R83DRAFT_9243 [Lanmaoa asiatica]|nr:hypothetical protein J3R83DRAFT_9243 [Lanmaoa asiatica]
MCTESIELTFAPNCLLAKLTRNFEKRNDLFGTFNLSSLRRVNSELLLRGDMDWAELSMIQLGKSERPSSTVSTTEVNVCFRPQLVLLQGALPTRGLWHGRKVVIQRAPSYCIVVLPYLWLAALDTYAKVPDTSGPMISCDIGTESSKTGPWSANCSHYIKYRQQK